MTKFRKIVISILGNVEETGSERYFIIVTCFTAFVFLLLLCAVHMIMNLKIEPVILAGSSSIIILGLYLLVRFGTCLFLPKVILSILGLLILDFTWYFKFLSNGPLLFFILIFGALILWVWDGKALSFFLVLYFLNTVLLYVIEKHTPATMLTYQNTGKRTLDIYLSFLLYSTLLIFLLYTVKHEFIRQKDNAVKSDRLKSAFLANMSHEIRTPMNAIVGFSYLLSKDGKSESEQQYINIIQRSSENLLRLINDIIDLSKIEAGDMEIKNSALRIKDFFCELKILFSMELERRERNNVTIDYILPDKDIFISTDHLRLKQILSNLISNAIKFTSQGQITFSCMEKGNELIFNVSDTGTGIPDEDQNKIFKRFVKFNYLNMNTEGSGIGLAIVERLVKLLDGRIWFSSIFGKGSSFSFAIPFNEIPDHIKTPENTKTLNLASVKSGEMLVLLVEDDNNSYRLLKEMLKPLNIQIHHVTDGKGAIEFVKDNPSTRLILMDIKLPLIDGYEATRAIKRINQAIPIIAQSAYTMIGDREKAIEAGCDDYIAKPIDQKKLHMLVTSYLSVESYQFSMKG